MKILSKESIKGFFSDFREKISVMKSDTGVKPPVVHIVVALLGFGVSVLAQQSHAAIAENAGKLFCDLGEVVSCTRVMGSEYGEIFGISMGYFGMSFWTIVWVVSILPLFVKAEARWIAGWRLLVGSVGLFAALALAVITFGILNAVCQICEAIQLLCILYFILTLIAFRKTGRLVGSKLNLPAFVRLSVATFMAGMIPLTVGFVITPSAAAEIKGLSVSAKNMKRDAVYKETGNHSLGNKDASVVITEFTDFECFWCRRLHSRLYSEIEKAGAENVLLIFRNYVLKYKKYSPNIALAARCAGQEGHFWEFADWAFSKAGSAGKNSMEMELYFSREGLIDKAVELGVSEDRFIACYESKEEAVKIAEDMKEAIRLGLKGTPYILLNGKPYKGSWNRPGQLARDIRIAAGLEVDDIESIEISARDESFLSFFFPHIENLIDKLVSGVRKTSIDVNNDGKPDNYSYSLKKFGIMTIILVDTDLDGKIDDFSWVKGNLKEPDKSMLLYSESIKKENKNCIWFGPGNVKMVGQEDLDKNGTMETIVYYNRNAKPKVIQRIVARFETDIDGDDKPEVWSYPGKRMEIDSDNDGKPDLFTVNKEEILKNFKLLTKGIKIEDIKKRKITGKPLYSRNSWALHPELIKEKRFQAVIPHSLTGFQH